MQNAYNVHELFTLKIMSNIQVRNIDPKIKASAEAIFKQMGLSSSAAIKMFLNQVAVRKEIPFQPSGVDENGFSPAFQARLDAAIADSDESEAFESAEELIKHLHAETKN